MDVGVARVILNPNLLFMLMDKGFLLKNLVLLNNIMKYALQMRLQFILELLKSIRRVIDRLKFLKSEKVALEH